ncbi:GAF domain-containing protein [Aureimonas glaciei]|uniref:GAF domain-containing protein n=1 Tax=Aureimonas glaciei TaxID=1776957 RepID=A0A916Y871_9HYPH|nr:GAF domain-containing protein [Aureimonas glaciei]GGD34332.1 hypothetical protein GCM10011335_41740 [Aureimonas glaciei]
MIDKDILTTADTATLLGVSVRTAQLLIEGGSVPSWKTPGGHRRVYRSDVEALIEGPATAPSSVLVVVIAAAERLGLYDRLFSAIPECSVEGFADPFAALLAIGSLRPFAVVVDLEDGDPSRQALLPSLMAVPALRRILTVGTTPPPDGEHRATHVGTPDAAAAGLRMVLADAGGSAIPPVDATFPIALNERQRLVALERSGLVDTAPEAAFDRLAWLAAETLETPVALVTLLTPTRQWFKSRVGLDFTETPRSWSFCNHTILQKGIFAIPDLSLDPRFAANPAVVGAQGFRFYAGAAVRDDEGFAVGSLCVIDTKPRVLEETQEKTLQALAGLASDQFRLRAAERQLREARRPRNGPSAAGGPARRSGAPGTRRGNGEDRPAGD